ncbi:PTS sugar transporter subunit IIA [Atlantibacter subterraneus]|uniref:PTS sugar transporter subunit IIA n=1 Tax=Atlantibacter subterraneus TaxID=255519 RepID=A0A3R9GTK3_9ENTR|nr:PTS sugar transporter subunit IIA [Atlantibacter subterranea]MDA3134976.1 PTS sugar transporter subunit IIA [Atlantibacter subterranea]MDW2742943.1 PTS sugar transporter subunit IIA [Atlantibacter subterranea]RSB63203.1 PTS sugar transporter subunit IIA [Atlantibacter subterranea]RSE05931.1 PTS sugar transporter subunit IIA [Atlantibacter subterranea]RSE27236.1 PTS sugar transporter subunit IIA [Atlantibacter subterranea]
MLNDVKWVQACRNATDWREALAIAIEPLIRHGAAQAAYLDGVIENTLAWGPYYVVAPGIALPHARPEQGAMHNQIAVTTLQQPVTFGHEECDPVWLLIALTATDANRHIATIQRISQWLGDEAFITALRHADDDSALYQLLKQSLVRSE